VNNVLKLIRYLGNVFGLNTNEQSDDGIILDYYYYNLIFAKEENFTAEKISAFFSIMKQTLYDSLCLNKCVISSLLFYSIYR
jgi:hypothetical protein